MTLLSEAIRVSNLETHETRDWRRRLLPTRKIPRISGKIGLQMYWLKRDCKRFGIEADGLIRDIEHTKRALFETLGYPGPYRTRDVGQHPHDAEWPCFYHLRELREIFADLELLATIATEPMRRKGIKS